MSRLFCFGAGYSAKAAADLMKTKGWTVAGTTRSHDGMAKLAAAGITPVHFDGTQRNSAVSEVLLQATHVLVSVAPDELGASPDAVLRWHGDDLATAPHLSWVGYLSTIGVYGDHGGGWVDETTEATPQTARSQRRLVAETAWRALAARSAWQVQVFRLAGIYGPGRSPLDRVRAGRARRIIKPGQVFNRIHVADIAASLEAAMLGRGTHQVYNVTDNEPAKPQDVIAEAARLLGRSPPPEVAFEAADLSDMARSFYDENKRVRNDRLKHDLAVDLRYPTYREGLAALV